MTAPVLLTLLNFVESPSARVRRSESSPDGQAEPFHCADKSACDLVAGPVRLRADPFDFEFGDALQEDAFKLGKGHGVACRVRCLLQLLESHAERIYRVGHGSQSHSDLDVAPRGMEAGRSDNAVGLVFEFWHPSCPRRLAMRR